MRKPRVRLYSDAARKVRKIRPYSRPHVLAKLDGRTREAQLMTQVRKDLTAHCGGNPTIPQKMLIERAVMLSLRVAQIDEVLLTGKTLSMHDSNFALAWNNALRRTLQALGQQTAAVPPTPSLRDYFGSKGEAAD